MVSMYSRPAVACVAVPGLSVSVTGLSVVVYGLSVSV